jgi:REP element-mobilizing transposase RayT
MISILASYFQFRPMSNGYRIAKKDAAYFLTFTVVGWVDIFSRDTYKQIICESLNYCILHKGLEIFAYVIVSNHIYLIAIAKSNNLSDIIRDFKIIQAGK